MAEQGFITIITIFVFLYHVQTSLFPRASPLRTAEQFGAATALVFIRQFGILLSQPPNHEVPDIKTKQNSWGSFYALQDLRCHPAGLSSSQGLLFRMEAKIPARPRVLLGVFAEQNPAVQDLTKFCTHFACTSALPFQRFLPLQIGSAPRSGSLSFPAPPLHLPLFFGGGRKCQLNGHVPKESFIINHSPPERENKNVCGKDKAVRKGKGKKHPTLNPQQPPWKEAI